MVIGESTSLSAAQPSAMEIAKNARCALEALSAPGFEEQGPWIVFTLASIEAEARELEAKIQRLASVEAVSHA